MPITEERLRQTFSEGGAQEIYQEVRATGDFLGFAHQYAFNQDSKWQTKVTTKHLSASRIILLPVFSCDIHCLKESQKIR